MAIASESIETAIDERSSRLPGFYRLTAAERLAAIAEWAGLSDEELSLVASASAPSYAEAMIENAVGAFPLPLGIATNFVVNGREILVPMAIEEPSVVAAASHGALLARSGGGFEAQSSDPVMIGQVQVLGIPNADLESAARRVDEHRKEILEVADSTSRSLPALGGGSTALSCRLLDETRAGPMLAVHLYFDTRDAMGANAVNTACEAISPLIAQVTGGEVRLRILSNLSDRRLASARCRVAAEALGRAELDGVEVARRIAEADAFAHADPYRAATHNKGVMNGVDPVVIATGNDWRGVEAGAHSYAARDGRYRALTEWEVDDKGDLVGHLELPMAVGTVGGATKSHPVAAACLKILGVEGAQQLAEVIASVGLAQNLSALRALVSEGIQPGHMALHARQLALAAGAAPEDASRIAEQMVSDGDISASYAAALVSGEHSTGSR